MKTARILFALTLLPASGLAQQSAPLSESLPADTLFYIEIPDIPALRDGLQGSAIGRVWNDESTQAFMGDMVSEATGQFDGAMAMLAEEGVPVQFMSWEAMQSLEVGLSMMGMGDSNMPGIMMAAQIQFADGLGEAAFGLASAMLASGVGADLFIVSTGVDRVAINYGMDDEEWLDHMTVAEAKAHMADGQFDPGSMGPKIQAMINYLEDGGKKGLIIAPENLVEAVEGRSGTVFER